MSRYSVVVDEDIDPSNLQEVMWAVATRTDPAIDIDIIQRGMGSKNDPMFVAYPYDAPFSSKAIIDACRPCEHLHEFPGGGGGEQGAAGKGAGQVEGSFLDKTRQICMFANC